MLNIEYPWLLILLPLPLLINWLIPAAQQIQDVLYIPFLNRIKRLSSNNPSHNTFGFKSWRAWLLWLLLLIASTNPTWSGDPIQIERSGRDLMLAIDLSQSMEIPDMQVAGQSVDRLTALKQVAGDFINHRKGDRLGMILFGSHAYLQTPLTFDWHTIQYMLNDASIGLAGPTTAIGDALGLAIKYLKDLPGDNKVIILLTDGANNAGQLSPLDSAEIAAKLDIKIYTIGLGSDSMVIQSLLGPHTINPSQDLDETSLQKISEMTGGHYFRARDTAGLAEIYQLINQLEPIIHDQFILRPQKPLYPYFLVLALLLNVTFHLIYYLRTNNIAALKKVKT